MAEIKDGVHKATKPEWYVEPTDPNVLEHLEWFKDQKLGFMLHWAPGSQFGVVESWSPANHSPWDEPTLAPWQEQRDRVLVNTCGLPLYDMKYADCLKIIF